MTDNAINTRAIGEALGADPSDYERIIPLMDRLLTALRDGETIVFYHGASSPSAATMMKLAEPGNWDTLIKTDLPRGVTSPMKMEDSNHD